MSKPCIGSTCGHSPDLYLWAIVDPQRTTRATSTEILSFILLFSYHKLWQLIGTKLARLRFSTERASSTLRLFMYGRSERLGVHYRSLSLCMEAHRDEWSVRDGWQRQTFWFKFYLPNESLLMISVGINFSLHDHLKFIPEFATAAFNLQRHKSFLSNQPLTHTVWKHHNDHFFSVIAVCISLRDVSHQIALV